MRKLLLAIGLVLMASGAQASSYLDIFGVVHDPILYNTYEAPGDPFPVHAYSGPNLQPGVVAPGAHLRDANLTGANLNGASRDGLPLGI